MLALNACGKDRVMPTCDEFQAYQGVVEAKRVVSPDGLDSLDEFKEMPIQVAQPENTVCPIPFCTVSGSI